MDDPIACTVAQHLRQAGGPVPRKGRRATGGGVAVHGLRHAQPRRIVRIDQRGRDALRPREPLRCVVGVCKRAVAQQVAAPASLGRITKYTSHRPRLSRRLATKVAWRRRCT